MKIDFITPEARRTNTQVFLLTQEGALGSEASRLDTAGQGVITRALETARFTGKKEKALSVFGVPEVERAVILGVGHAEDDLKKPEDFEGLGASIYSFLAHARVQEANVVVEDTLGGFAPDFIAAHMALGARLRSYRFDKYKTKQTEEDKPTLTSLTFSCSAASEAGKRFTTLQAIAEGVELTRDVVSEPPNVLYPESYADIAKSLKSLGVKVEVLGEKEMAKLGMDALLGVGQGSVRESKLVVMHYQGGEKDRAPIAFVGKGVTFDTGGISIKPSGGMEDMKYDMAGSGTVVGLMKALAGRGARVNAVGVIGLTENMPGGNAQRPSDVVTSMSGQTIEVLNTDAEGRLVLADALWYTQDRFKPRFMVDLATLTGACVVALGVHRAGLLSNDDTLAERIFQAGERTGEEVWRLPLGKAYDKQIDSKIADVQNIGNGKGKGAGTITAAQFLQRFVNETPWAHLDIAGVAWADRAKGITPEGASGFGVRLLNALVAEHYED